MVEERVPPFEIVVVHPEPVAGGVDIGALFHGVDGIPGHRQVLAASGHFPGAAGDVLDSIIPNRQVRG